MTRQVRRSSRLGSHFQIHYFFSPSGSFLSVFFFPNSSELKASVWFFTGAETDSGPLNEEQTLFLRHPSIFVADNRFPLALRALTWMAPPPHWLPDVGRGGPALAYCGPKADLVSKMASFATPELNAPNISVTRFSALAGHAGPTQVPLRIRGSSGGLCPRGTPTGTVAPPAVSFRQGQEKRTQKRKKRKPDTRAHARTQRQKWLKSGRGRTITTPTVKRLPLWSPFLLRDSAFRLPFCYTHACFRHLDQVCGKCLRRKAPDGMGGGWVERDVASRAAFLQRGLCRPQLFPALTHFCFGGFGVIPVRLTQRPCVTAAAVEGSCGALRRRSPRVGPA